MMHRKAPRWQDRVVLVLFKKSLNKKEAVVFLSAAAIPAIKKK